MPRPWYEAIIFRSGRDRAFIAGVPAVSGWAADDRTYRDALATTDVVLREWIGITTERGRPVPQLKGRLAFTHFVVKANP